jgi:hypothetical protein
VNFPHDRVTIRVVLPWLLAVAGVGFGSAVVFHQRAIPKPSAASVSEAKDIIALKAALASANAANEALRRELDRLRTGPATSSGAESGGASATTPPSDGKGPTIEQEQIGKRLQDALARMEAGDTAAKAEAAQAVLALLQSGPGAGPVLRDAYLNSHETLGKALVIGSMAFANASETKDLVIDQVQSEKDPVLRQVLMKQAAKYATPEVANALQGTFIQSVDSTDDAQTRIAAIRGLRYASGADGVQALMHAAADPSEDVRLAAIDVLLARQPQDPMLAQLIANDASPRVREFAHCQQVVTSELAPPPRKRSH